MNNALVCYTKYDNIIKGRDTEDETKHIVCALISTRNYCAIVDGRFLCAYTLYYINMTFMYVFYFDFCTFVFFIIAAAKAIFYNI